MIYSIPPLRKLEAWRAGKKIGKILPHYPALVKVTQWYLATNWMKPEARKVIEAIDKLGKRHGSKNTKAATRND